MGSYKWIVIREKSRNTSGKDLYVLEKYKMLFCWCKVEVYCGIGLVWCVG